jgi:hypothetical protein
MLAVFSSSSDQSEGVRAEVAEPPNAPKKEIIMFRSTLKRGFSRKAVAFAGLMLAFAILSPASALAKAEGTDRPIKGSGTGTITLDPVTGAFTGVVPGVSSELGKVTVQIEGAGAPTSDGTFAGSGTVTIVAASGDELTGTMTLTQTVLPTGRTTTTVAVTITGGTERFADASGTLTVICQSGPPSLVGGLLLIKAECKFTGQISY